MLKSKTGFVFVGLYLLAIPLALLYGSIVHCSGEWCGFVPFAAVLYFWGWILQAVFPSSFWDVESMPWFHPFVFLLNLLTAYMAGVCTERLCKTGRR